jgi:hypothetical protein
MKIPAALVFMALFGSPSFASGLPAPLLKLSRQGVAISEVVYKSETHYLNDMREKCCDLGAHLFNAQGHLVCRYIGIAGAWENPCADFDKTARLVRIIKPAAPEPGG